MKDALALGGEEGRDKLRKAVPRGKYPHKHGYPNGATQPPAVVTAYIAGQTRGTETSKYPEEEKITMIAQVVASERARAQTAPVTAGTGLKDRRRSVEDSSAERPGKACRRR